jgi:phospholipid/cholesterol/gamma-HCH transport system substrate-binding protein
MQVKAINLIKLGTFVISGLALIILLLYMIGKNRNLFGSSLIIKAKFENVQGLKSGNNVRYGGIDIGTVDEIVFIDDSTLEVNMRIENKMKEIIRKNAIVSIGTDGLVGNKVINIISTPGYSENIANKQLLPSKKAIDTDEMMRTLYKTNNNIAIVTDELKQTTTRINNSKVIWKLLDNETMDQLINKTIINLKSTSQALKTGSEEIKGLIASVKNGKGGLGLLISDSGFQGQVQKSMNNIEHSSKNVTEATEDFKNIAKNMEKELANEKGVVQMLLRDSLLSSKANQTISNIEKGTKGFDQIMQALKSSFLFRGYFRKQNKKMLSVE